MVLFQRMDSVDNPLYVLAIAGTNVNSIYGWMQEDMDTDTVCKWPDKENGFKYALCDKSEKDTSKQTVALGSMRGLIKLLEMEDPKTSKKVFETLKTITDTASKKGTLAVAGHSLGGGLAPLMAVALIDNQTKWDSTSKLPVAAYPTAGPSPWNGTFARSAGTKIAAQGGMHGAWNSLDMVPHAWEESLMKKIVDMYQDNNITKLCFPKRLIHCQVENTKHFRYTQIPVYKKQEFTGTFNNASVLSNSDLIIICDSAKAKDPEAVKDLNYALMLRCKYIVEVNPFVPKHCDNAAITTPFGETLNFFSQAGYQHTFAYIKHFNIDSAHMVIGTYMSMKNADFSNASTLMDQVSNKLIKPCLE